MVQTKRHVAQTCINVGWIWVQGDLTQLQVAIKSHHMPLMTGEPNLTLQQNTMDDHFIHSLNWGPLQPPLLNVSGAHLMKSELLKNQHTYVWDDSGPNSDWVEIGLWGS